jgi:AcrR family transcriptional regulator
MKADAQRADSRATRQALIDAVESWVAQHDRTPERLVDIAALAGVATATAYRHFDSVDAVVQAYISSFPLAVNERFARLRAPSDGPVDQLHRWNRAWVITSLEMGSIATSLRSTEGFLARRARREPIVMMICERVEPLLVALSPDNVVHLLSLWNVVTDPREVLDLHHVLRWSPARIAASFTDVVAASANMR